MKNVIFSEKAYMNLLAEVNEHTEDTTAGLFLGFQEDELWYVLECLEPGPRSNFSSSGFTLDEAYIRYRIRIYQRIYKSTIEVLGLWHVHAGYIRMFTASDDLTNRQISKRPGGSIAAMITLKDGFSMSMFYVPENLHYDKISWITGDSLIPKQYSIHQTPDFFKGMIKDKSDSHSYRHPAYENPRTPERPGDRKNEERRNETTPENISGPEKYSTTVYPYDEAEEIPSILYGLSSLFEGLHSLIHRLNDKIYNMMAPFDPDSDGEEFMEEESRKSEPKQREKKHRRHHLFHRRKDEQRDPDFVDAFEDDGAADFGTSSDPGSFYRQDDAYGADKWSDPYSDIRSGPDDRYRQDDRF